MGSPDWYAQQEAKGICFICKRKLDDKDPKQAHSECHQLRNKGYRFKQIRLILEERRNAVKENEKL